MALSSESVTKNSVTSCERLTHARIFRFFVPLAGSWVLMSLESPIVAVFLALLPNSEVNFAAIGVMFVIAFWIESPVIGLLSTATALAINRQHYLVLRAYVIGIITVVTIVAGLVALTPIYDLIVRVLLGVPGEVADAARPALIIMIPWSGFIGWRRYTQGILIRNGKTFTVGLGTVLRVIGVAGIGYLLFAMGTLPGAWVAAGAILGSVVLESLFTHVLAREVIRKTFSEEKVDEAHDPLTLRELNRFHLPLTMSTMLWLLGRPIVTWGLARTPNPTLSLAAWEPAGNTMFIFRAPGMALPEVVIALQQTKETARALMSFCGRVGFVCSTLVGVFSFTPIAYVFLHDVLHIEDSISSLAVEAMKWSVLVPLIGGYQSYYRGMLAKYRQTKAMTVSMAVYVMATFISIRFVVSSGTIDVRTAAVCLTVAMAVELVVLWWLWRRYQDVNPLLATEASLVSPATKSPTPHPSSPFRSRDRERDSLRRSRSRRGRTGRPGL